jgi:diguanylate cyclase (GGDEF)-like protein
MGIEPAVKDPPTDIVRRTSTRPELAPPLASPALRTGVVARALTAYGRVKAWHGVAIVAGCLLGIYKVDDLTSAELSVSVFYLLPILLASWRFGARGGMTMAFLCGTLSFAVDKKYHHVFSHPAFLYWDAAVHFTFFAAFSYVLAELRTTYVHIANLARMDTLTGLANRRRFYELAEHELFRSRRSGQPLTLILIDVDNFKQLNDTQGHGEGDRALEMVAARLKKLRKTDVACRVGGDEFVVLMPDTPPDAAQAVVDELHAHMTREAEQARWPVTFSVGVVTYPRPPDSVEAMVHRADEAMYTVKRGTKNGVAYAVVKPE